VTTLAPRPLTDDERVVLAVVADTAAWQRRSHPLISRTSVLRAASNRGLSKMAARAAWHRLVEHGVLAPADDGLITPHPRPQGLGKVVT
jgi:hypothetical protein